MFTLPLTSIIQWYLRNVLVGDRRHTSEIRRGKPDRARAYGAGARRVWGREWK